VARVVLPRQLAERLGADAELELAVRNVRELLAELDRRFPGLGTQLGRESAVAIDGEIIQEPLLEPIAPESEVHFLPPIGGGSSGLRAS
jgi:molybdopterin converting factor small subunit